MEGNGEFKSDDWAYGLPSLFGGYLAAEMDYEELAEQWRVIESEWGFEESDKWCVTDSD